MNYTYDIDLKLKEVWALHALFEEKYRNNVVLAFPLEELNLALFKQAIEELFRRHESLRTKFSIVEGKLVHEVLPVHQCIPNINIRDIRNVANRKEKIEEIKKSEEAYPINLEAWPFLRVSVLIVGEPQVNYMVLLNGHHVILDTFGQNVLTQQIIDLYTAFLQGDLQSVPLPKAQYKDYFDWLNTRMTGARAKEVKENWQKRLKEIHRDSDGSDKDSDKVKAHRKRLGNILDQRGITDKTLHYISKAFPFPAEDKKAAGYRFFFGGDDYKRLEQLLHKNQITLFTFAIACYSMISYFLQKRKSHIISFSVSDRQESGYKEQIGSLATSAFIYTELNESLAVDEYLKKVHYEVFDAIQNRRYPLLLQLQEEEIFTPYDHLVSLYINYPDTRIGNKSRARDTSTYHKEEKEGYFNYYNMSSYVADYVNGFEISSSYRESKFAAKDIELFFELYRQVILNYIKNPSQKISTILAPVSSAVLI